MSNPYTAGATPVVAGATPVQSQPASPAAAPSTAPATPATGDPEALGDAGKRALDAMKAERKAAEDRAKAAEAELEQIRAANLTETEKVIAQARKDGASEVLSKITARVRQSETRSALIAAGASPSFVDLAIRAPEFDGVKVADDGTVDGLDEALTAFRKAHPDVFTKAPAGGSFDTGTGGGARPGAGRIYTREQLRDPEFFRANQADIMAAQREGRIRTT